MNTKRWIVILLSIGIFVFSIFVSAVFGMFKLKDSGTFKDIMGEQFQSGTTTIRKGSTSKKIAVLDINGTIIDGASSPLEIPTYNHSSFLKKLDKVKDDKTVKALILNVDTPGGGVYESSQLRDRLLEIKSKKKIPIYVVMKSMAASGGYYISADATKIFASKETMTGSIGVIMSGMNFSGLMEKYGVKDETIKSGEFKDIGSATRPATDKDRAVLQEMIDSAYNRFVNIVANGRKMDIESAKKVADGRIFDGEQAKELKLVDEIGDFDIALKSLSEEYKLKDAQVFSYSNDDFMGILNILNSKFGSKSKDTLLSKIDPSTPRMMYMYGN